MITLLSVLVVGFHVRFMQHAGGLWRDEAHTIAYATQDTISHLFQYLHTDSFPILSSLIFRAWAGTGWGATDASLRVLGLAVGLAILGTLFLNARLMGRTSPLISIALLGFSPLFIRVGDSIRPYGLGMVFMLLSLGFIWRLTQRPTLGWSVLAALGALASVQTLYQNSLLLFGICMGGILVCLHRKHWSRAALIFGVGAVAALSLVPYWSVIERTGMWRVLLYLPIDLKDLWPVSTQALSTATPSFLWIWLAVAVLGGLIVLFWSWRRPSAANDLSLGLFCISALGLGGALYFVFLLKSETAPLERYFLPLVALAASCIGAIVGRGRKIGALRIVLALVVVLLAAEPVWEKTEVRQTNMDLAAARLQQVTRQDDLIVVQPWYYGPSFHRYYAGPAPWVTLPPLKVVRMVRYDLLKERISQLDPIRPVLVRIAATLQAGNRVWFLEALPEVNPAASPRILAPAPQPIHGWSLLKIPFTYNWAARASHLVASHSTMMKTMDPSPGVPVQADESVLIQFAAGWR